MWKRKICERAKICGEEKMCEREKRCGGAEKMTKKCRKKVKMMKISLVSR